MTARKPVMVWSLSCFLAEEMEAREWTAVDVAQRMPGDYATNVIVVNLLLAVSEKDTLKFEAKDAEPLAVAFGVSPEFFLNIHRAWKENPEARQPFEVPEHLFDGVVFPANDDAEQPSDLPRGDR